jgi:N-acetylmuramoyl-L-alanine amidase
MNRIYLSPSNQQENIGVSTYGTEESEMYKLANRVKYFLSQTKQFEIFMPQPEYTLEQVTKDSDSLAVDIHVCLHSDATGTNEQGGGTTVFSYDTNDSHNGHRLADLLYKYVAPISSGKDHGVIARPTLFEIRATKASSALLECFFHSNIEEVEYFLSHVDEYARAISKAICEYFNVKFVLPVTDSGTTAIPAWKIEGAMYLKEKSYTDDIHDPLEKVDIGTLGTILRNMDRKRGF